jgi:hypothetical protein
MDPVLMALNCANLENGLKKVAFDFLETEVPDDQEKVVVLQATALSFYVTIMLATKMDPDEIILATKTGIVACREYERNKGTIQ